MYMTPVVLFVLTNSVTQQGPPILTKYLIDDHGLNPVASMAMPELLSQNLSSSAKAVHAPSPISMDAVDNQVAVWPVRVNRTWKLGSIAFPIRVGFLPLPKSVNVIGLLNSFDTFGVAGISNIRPRNASSDEAFSYWTWNPGLQSWQSNRLLVNKPSDSEDGQIALGRLVTRLSQQELRTDLGFGDFEPRHIGHEPGPVQLSADLEFALIRFRRKKDNDSVVTRVGIAKRATDWAVQELGAWNAVWMSVKAQKYIVVLGDKKPKKERSITVFSFHNGESIAEIKADSGCVANFSPYREAVKYNYGSFKDRKVQQVGSDQHDNVKKDND